MSLPLSFSSFWPLSGQQVAPPLALPQAFPSCAAVLAWLGVGAEGSPKDYPKKLIEYSLPTSVPGILETYRSLRFLPTDAHNLDGEARQRQKKKKRAIVKMRYLKVLGESLFKCKRSIMIITVTLNEGLTVGIRS